MRAEMSIREHLEELRIRVFRVALSIIIITIFAMTFDLRPVEVAGLPLAYPYPDPIHNGSARLTLCMQENLLPDGVKLIQTAPGQAFFAQMSGPSLIGMTASIPLSVRNLPSSIPPTIKLKA